MTRKVDIGAPSLTGKGAELIAAAFVGAAYPIPVSLTSHLNFDISLPEIDGMPELKSVFYSHLGLNKANATIRDEAQFMRLASSIEQIAELNNLTYPAITIEEIVVSAEQHNEAGKVVADDQSNDQAALDGGNDQAAGNDQADSGNTDNASSGSDDANANADVGSGNDAADDNPSSSDSGNTSDSTESTNAADAAKTQGRKHRAATK